MIMVIMVIMIVTSRNAVTCCTLHSAGSRFWSLKNQSVLTLSINQNSVFALSTNHKSVLAF